MKTSFVSEITQTYAPRMSVYLSSARISAEYTCLGAVIFNNGSREVLDGFSFKQHLGAILISQPCLSSSAIRFRGLSKLSTHHYDLYMLTGRETRRNTLNIRGRWAGIA